MVSMTASALGAAILTNGVLAAIFLTLFSVLRILPQTRDFYQSRVLAKSVVRRPPPLPVVPFLRSLSPFAWLPTLLRMSEDMLGDTSGLDSLLAVRMLRFGRILFLGISALSLVIILPANLSGHQVAALGLKDLDRASIANVADGATVLWAHAVFLCLATLFTLALLDRFSTGSVALRLRFQATEPPGGPGTTVMVSDMPGTAAGTRITRALSYLDTGAWFIPAFIRRRLIARLRAAATAVANAAVAGPAARPAAALDSGASTGAGLLPRDLMLSGAAARRAGRGVLTGGAAPGKKEGGAVSGYATPASDPGLAPDKGPWIHVRILQGAVDPPSGAGAGDGPTDALLPRLPEVRIMPGAWAESQSLLAAGLSFEEMARLELLTVYGEESVTEVSFVKDVKTLEALNKEFEALKQRAELTIDIYAQQVSRKAALPDGKESLIKPRRTKVIAALLGDWGKEFVTTRGGKRSATVDTLEYCAARARYLKTRIMAEQEACRDRPSPTAFVSFRTREAAAVASQVMLHHDVEYWRAGVAPRPQEILWRNLLLRSWEMTLRRSLMTAAYILLIAFYVIPVTFVQGFLDVNRWVNSHWPVLGDVYRLPALEAFLQGFLPGFAMVLFLIILPPLLRWWERIGGAKSVSAVETAVVTKLFWFQVVTLFFFNLGVSSLAKEFQSTLKHPSTLPAKLASNVPGTFSFFTSYMLVVSLGGNASQLCNIVGGILFWVFNKLAPTQRTKARLLENTTYSFSSRVPSHSITVLICLAYAFVTPVLPLIGLVYMCMATVETKYVVAYMATSAFDTGGAMWLQFRSHVLSAVVILQILAIAVLGLKKAGGPAGLTLALLVCTIVYWIVAGPAAARPVATTALKTAQDIDALQGECKVSQPAVGMYVHPGMRLKGEDFDGVAEEAERMLAVMQVYHQGSDGRLQALEMVQRAEQARAEGAVIDVVV